MHQLLVSQYVYIMYCIEKAFTRLLKSKETTNFCKVNIKIFVFIIIFTVYLWAVSYVVLGICQQIQRQTNKVNSLNFPLKKVPQFHHSAQLILLSFNTTIMVFSF